MHRILLHSVLIHDIWYEIYCDAFGLRVQICHLKHYFVCVCVCVCVCKRSLLYALSVSVIAN